MWSCYALNWGGKTVNVHQAQSHDQGPMNKTKTRRLSARENFSFNLQRLHLLHQCVLKFQSDRILSLEGLREEDRQERD